MGKDWHFGKKCRRKLFVPKKKLKHNLANLSSKKCESVINDYQQVIIYNLLFFFLINNFFFIYLFSIFFNSIDNSIIRIY